MRVSNLADEQFIQLDGRHASVFNDRVKGLLKSCKDSCFVLFVFISQLLNEFLRMESTGSHTHNANSRNVKVSAEENTALFPRLF